MGIDHIGGHKLLEPDLMLKLLTSSFARPALVAALFAGTMFSAPFALAEEKIAIFAGGCFWCIESDFEKMAGVREAVSGYTGGSNENPTYRNHSKYMHREVVKIFYDDTKVSYEKLLHTFWRTVDPTDGGGQFCDRGHSYTTAIYALDDEQRVIAEKSKKAAFKALGVKIATPIEMAVKFTAAEDYHQNYYKKNPIRYNYYRTACGRNRNVKSIWGDQAYAGLDKHS